MLATVPQNVCALKIILNKGYLRQLRVESGFLKLVLKFRARREITRIVIFFTFQPSELLKIGFRNSYLKIRIYFHMYSVIAKSF